MCDAQSLAGGGHTDAAHLSGALIKVEVGLGALDQHKLVLPHGTSIGRGYDSEGVVKRKFGKFFAIR